MAQMDTGFFCGTELPEDKTMLLRYPKLIRTFLSVLLTTLFISACGGGGDGAAPSPVTPSVATGQQASATMQAQGVTVTLTTSEGAVFTLVVPSGALPEGTNVSISTEQPTANNRFSLRLSPADTVLTNGLKARLLITLPQALRTRPNAVIVYDRVPLAYSVSSAGQIEFELSRFAAQPLSPISALMESIRATTPSPRGCTLPTLSSYQEGTLADTALTSIEAYGACMLDAVNALAASGNYEDAARAASATAAMLQMAGSHNTALILGFIDSASRIACTAQRAALDAAQISNVTTTETLYPLIKPVYFWQTVIQQLGAQCSQIGPNELETVIDAKISQAIAYYTSQKSLITNTSSDNYSAAVAEARAGQQTLQEVKSLQAPTSVQQNMTQEIEQRAQPALLDSMLQAPWQRCRDSGNFDELIRLMDLLHQPQTVKDAAQYCATRLQAVSRLSNGDVAETLSPALGGERAGTNNTRGSLYVPRNGRLELSGAIAALGCPSGRTGGSEGLSVRIAGVEVRRLEAPYLGSPAFIEMASALQTAGVAEAAFEAPLTIERVGAPCAGFWGESPTPLLQLDLSFNNDMRVTVFRTIDSCNVLVDPTPPFSDAKYFRSAVTDESTRMSLPVDRRANCGPRDWTVTQQLRRVDAHTLRWQQDARWSFNWFAEGSFGQWMYYNIQFARAGRVTLTFEQTAGSCIYREGSGAGMYSYALARSGLERGVSGCVTEGVGSAPSFSFDVVAGQTQSFLSYFTVLPTEESDTLTREHASTHTIRFEPAP